MPSQRPLRDDADAAAIMAGVALAVRRSPWGERRAGRGGRRPGRPSALPLLPEQDESLPATVFSCGHSLASGAGYDFHGRRRGDDPWLLLQYGLDGEGRCWIRGREHRLVPGTLLCLVVPGDHRIAVPEGGRWRFCYASLRGAEAVRAGIAATGAGPILALGHRHPVATALARLVRDLVADPPPDAWELSARAYALAMALRRMPAAAGPMHALAAAIAGREAAAGIDDLCAALGCGRRQLIRRFSAALGSTPSRWLADRRLDAAERRIAAGAPLAAVAAACGFSSASHLVRAFRRRHGATPGRWRGPVRCAADDGRAPAAGRGRTR